ncbi:MAG TPA: SBBP repeat-containing protein, partial [Thermomicrobiales bacterium]|nr:SBBP repeat-containing protein [Thermomicrobiales bacterium]
EYDCTVAPAADSNQIQLQIDGASGLSLDAAGNLLIHTAGSDLVEKAPALYQEVNGHRVAVSGQFVIEGGNRVGFAVGSYDAARPLVIDPILSYSTYLGGVNTDAAGGIAVDGAGNAYLTGFTNSSNFPTTAGAYRTVLTGSQDVFVTKINAAGTGLVYSTYIGGSGDDEGAAIAVDALGSAYLTGFTNSTNFPFTGGVVQPSLGGFTDAFVVKLSTNGGGLVYSTYLGGNGNDAGRGIAVDGFGSAYITGETSSTNFPTTPGAFDTVLTTFQSDAFVTKLNANGTALAYSSFLGGRGLDVGTAIAVDGFGIAFVTGSTTSTDFATTPGAYRTSLAGGQDAFVTSVNPDGRSLRYSTYLGGSADDGGAGIAVDGADSAYVTGFTNSTNFPTTPGAFQTATGRGTDAFVTKFSFNGQ